MFKGYHATKTLPIHPGQEVVIPKGTRVKSMNPSKREFVTKRSMTVKVNWLNCGSEMEESHFQADLDKGFLNPNAEVVERTFETLVGTTYTRQYRILSNPVVVWAGSGGYWNEVDINDVLK